jgi:predicted ArsR family transcriptional regulator
MNKRLFETTRGQLIALMRGREQGVRELAEELGVTENAVRAHLASLERDGLVELRGVRKAFRRPQTIYALTEKAELLFPKAYAEVLDALLTVMETELPEETLGRLLQAVGRRLALEIGDKVIAQDPVEKALGVFAQLGGLAQVENEAGKTMIRGDSCPFAAVAANHPHVCRMVAALLEQLLARDVSVRCSAEPFMQCCFHLGQGKRSPQLAKEG